MTMAKFIKWVFIICIVCTPVFVMAQGFDDDVLDNPVPFDGGVSLLVAAGIGYGLKKARDKQKSQKEIDEKQ